MNYEAVALVDLGTQDEPLPMGESLPVRALPEMHNFASNEETANKARELLAILKFCREDRQNLEGDWRAIRNMERLQHDEGRKYQGRSNAYLPIYTRILSSITANLGRGLFPSEEYMDVVPLRPEPEMMESAKVTKTYLQWEFESVAQVKRRIKTLVRHFAGIGFTVIKHRYRKEMAAQGARKFDSLYGAQSYFSMKPRYEGLEVTPRDPFHWYVFPATAETLDDAQLCFEDMRTPVGYIMEMGRTGKWLNVDAALQESNPAEADMNEDATLAAAGMSRPDALTGNSLADSKRVTEVWCHLRLPSAAYAAGENTYLPVPARVVFVGETVVCVTRNPFFHQRPPYEVAVQNQSPGFFYGYGAGHIVRGMQYLANDFANQTNDCGAYTMNPIALVNPGLLAGPLKPLRPGVTWYTTDVNAGIRFDRPPGELVQYGQSLVAQYTGMANDLGGAPPIMQGTNTGGAAKTATGAQILQRNSTVPLQDVIEELELGLMAPLMKATHYYSQQYREDEVYAYVAGASHRITPQQLCMDADYRWLGSSQASSSAMRAQQSIQLIQALVPLVPIFMQQGYVVDFKPLVQRIYSDGLGMRGFDQVIKPAQAMGGMPMGGMPLRPEQMAGVQAEQGDRVRSAVEQAGGMGAGSVTPVAGEGEDFMDVRNQADEMAAMMGGQR